MDLGLKSRVKAFTRPMDVGDSHRDETFDRVAIV